MRIHRWAFGRSLVVLFAAVPLALSYAPAAFAAEGQSTPGISVKVINGSGQGTQSPVTIRLAAQSERGIDSDLGSCRPKDADMKCWGSLRVRVSEMGGLVIGNFEVHRVALVGDGSGHGGGHEGETGEEPTDGHTDGHTDSHASGHGSGHGSGHSGEESTVAEGGQRIAVSGVAVVKRPGTSGLTRGTVVQVKIMLTDNGKARYGDTVDVTINRFVEGPSKPLIYQSGPVTVQQVRLHTFGATG